MTTSPTIAEAAAEGRMTDAEMDQIVGTANGVVRITMSKDGIFLNASGKQYAITEEQAEFLFVALQLGYRGAQNGARP